MKKTYRRITPVSNASSEALILKTKSLPQRAFSLGLKALKWVTTKVTAPLMRSLRRKNLFLVLEDLQNVVENCFDDKGTFCEGGLYEALLLKYGLKEDSVTFEVTFNLALTVAEAMTVEDEAVLDDPEEEHSSEEVEEVEEVEEIDPEPEVEEIDPEPAVKTSVKPKTKAERKAEVLAKKRDTKGLTS